VLTPGEMAGSVLVAADAAARVFGPIADPFVTAISLISLVTIANATIMIFSRVIYAIARDAEIPHLMHVADNGTPRFALLVTILAGALLASVGVYDLLLAFSVSLLAAMGVCVNAAAIAMRLRFPAMERPYAMPLFPLPAVFALVVNTAFLAMFVAEDPLTAAEAFAVLAVLAACVFAFTRRVQPASLLLALRAPEGAAPALDKTRDRAAAGAWIAFAPIDSPGAGEIAELAAGLGVVADRRAAGLDRFGEDVLDRRHQPAERGSRDLAGFLVGPDMGAVERLADIDVTEPGDDPLVEQQHFHRGEAAGEGAREMTGGQVVAERLGPQCGERRPFLEPVGLDEIDRAEAARVVERKDVARAGL
jgi:hypothetical protein